MADEHKPKSHCGQELSPERLLSTGQQFAPRPFPGDIAAYVSRSITKSAYRYRMKLRLKGAAAQLAPQVPPWIGMIEAVDDTSCILHIGADSVEALAAQMVHTGADFEILDAPELVPALRQIADRLHRATR
jgi:hypothetical protein